MKQLWLFFLVFICALDPEPEGAALRSQPQTTIAVISDPHYYDPSLGTVGDAFDHYLSSDRKLLREGPELLAEALRLVRESGADLLLVPGDLTKDGTLLSHQGIAGYFSRMEAEGTRVFVVPGNHDVNNGLALSYHEDSTIRVENVNPERFVRVHADFGYSEALNRDPSSLSYLAEPVEGLWLLALDACLYDLNDSTGHSHTAGKFKKETIRWMRSILTGKEARRKTIIAMMHHGILEHYRTQERYFGEYVVKKNLRVARMLAKNDVVTIFTGHYHANDITLKKWMDGTMIYDIETGSLVTYPCPVRMVELSGDTMHIVTSYVDSLPSVPRDFPGYARACAETSLSEGARQVLLHMKLDPVEAGKLSPQIGEAFLAHLAGDEAEKKPWMDLDSIHLKSRIMISFRKDLVRGLHNDLPPADNQLTIHLSTGTCR